MSTFREDGKGDWDSGHCQEQIKIGAIQRIADACELMAKNHQALVDERDMYQRWWRQEQAKADRLERSNRGLRGYLKRIK